MPYYFKRLNQLCFLKATLSTYLFLGEYPKNGICLQDKSVSTHCFWQAVLRQKATHRVCTSRQGAHKSRSRRHHLCENRQGSPQHTHQAAGLCNCINHQMIQGIGPNTPTGLALWGPILPGRDNLTWLIYFLLLDMPSKRKPLQGLMY